MSCIVKSFTRVAAVALLGIALAPLPATGHGRHSPLVPPHANFRGRSFEEWNVLYVERYMETYYAGQTPCDMVGRVRLLMAAPGETEVDVRLRPGTPFVLPAFWVAGERYDDPNVPDDNPDDPFVDFIFEMTDVLFELDGRVIMDGAASEFCRYEFGPVYFDEPIVYSEPQPRGPNLNAVSALWTQGIGAIFHPLPAGRHTLFLAVDGPLGAGQTTWHITVR